VRLFQNRIKHRCEIARRRINNPQYLCGRGLLSERLVALGSALVELASKVSNHLLPIG